jgi:GNAT superfamily N-acetyltransferase
MALEPSPWRVIEVTGAGGAVVAADWLARAEPVHRQLRPQLPAAYAERMAQVFAGGARMILAADGEAVCGVAVWRLIENTYEGRRLYVDDLVSDAGRRSRGVGKTLLDWLTARARSLDCDVLALDSGTQRTDAHRFYFREGMVIPAFCFGKRLK